MKKIVAGLLALASLFALNGCGGGGGGGEAAPTPTPTSTISGTAAVGAPLAGATVTVKDAQGTSRTGTTAANGSYSLDSSGLTPPSSFR